MKRLLTALALVVVFAAASFADIQDFGKFTIDVPAGWTATPDGETIGIVKNDNSAAVSITVSSTDGVSLKEIAEAFVQALNGRNLQADGDNYRFEMTNANGVDSKAFLMGDSNNYGLVVVTGLENAPDEINAMINSITDK